LGLPAFAAAIVCDFISIHSSNRVPHPDALSASGGNEFHASVFKGAAKPPALCQGIPYMGVDRFFATFDPVVLPFEFQSHRTRGIRFLAICLSS